MTGTAQLSAPRGMLELDVVDASAIAHIGVDGTDVITIEVGRGNAAFGVYLTPTDATGRAIVGSGPAPTLAIADPTIATGAFDETITVGRVLLVRGLAVGTRTFDVMWGRCADHTRRERGRVIARM